MNKEALIIAKLTQKQLLDLFARRGQIMRQHGVTTAASTWSDRTTVPREKRALLNDSELAVFDRIGLYNSTVSLLKRRDKIMAALAPVETTEEVKSA